MRVSGGPGVRVSGGPGVRGGLEVVEGLGAGDPVDVEVPGGLEPGDGSFGPGAVFAVDRPGREPGLGQVPLQRPDLPGSAGDIPIAGNEHVVGGGERRGGLGAGDPVDVEPPGGLEPA